MIELDRQLTLAINSLHCPASDAIWIFMSEIWVWFPLYALILFLIIRRLGWKKGLIFIGFIAIAFFLCERCANITKNTVQRLRPCEDPDMLAAGIRVLLPQGGKWGFFSGHSCNSFCIATGSYLALRNDKRLKYRGYAIGIYLWAALVAISRVFVAKHFLGDILVGAVVGILIAGLCSCAAKKITERQGQFPS